MFADVSGNRERHDRLPYIFDALNANAAIRAPVAYILDIDAPIKIGGAVFGGGVYVIHQRPLQAGVQILNLFEFVIQ
jgi:hypothetical protein